jgi:hypothetical protein
LQIGEISVKHESQRFSFICALSASRGRAVERAGHFLLDALNGAGADADLAGNLQDAFAATQMRLDAFFDWPK